jgi:hypothetical protein
MLGERSRFPTTMSNYMQGKLFTMRALPLLCELLERFVCSTQKLDNTERASLLALYT